jgi:hypothetical protein
MKNIDRAIGAAGAGAIALIAVFLLAKPLIEVFSQLATSIAMPVTLIVSLILIGIAAAIFQKTARR